MSSPDVETKAKEKAARRFSFAWMNPFFAPLARLFDWIIRHSPLKSIPKVLALILIALFLVLGLQALLFGALYWMGNSGAVPPISYTEFVELLKKKQLGYDVIVERKTVIFAPDQRIIFTDLRDGQEKWIFAETAPWSQTTQDTSEALRLEGLNVIPVHKDFPIGYILIFTSQGILTMIPFLFFMWLIGGGGLKGIAEEFTTMRKARKSSEKGPSFDGIAGMKSAKKEMQEIIDYFEDPSSFEVLNARQPRGVLLAGPPGTGKSLLARATAHEAGVPFYEVSGADFIQVFIGVGAAKADSLFRQAIKNQPSIIFIDEAEAVAIGRDKVGPFESRERQSVVAKLLHLFDEISTENHKVAVLFATNYPELIDEALQRPGRFDKRIVTSSPDEHMRAEIFNIHLTQPKPTPLAEEISLEQLCKELSKSVRGFSGAAIESLVNAARLLARERKRRFVRREDFFDSIFKVVQGLPSDLIVLPEENERIGDHEAGHGYVSWILPDATPVTSIVLVPHGSSLGFNWIPEERDYHFYTEQQFRAQIKVALAGHITEKVIYGNYSTMASRDLERATILAKNMVFRYGMSKGLGLVSVEALHTMESGFGGNGFVSKAKEEALRIINECAEELTEILAQEEHKERIETLRKALILSERKTLDRPDIEKIIGKPKSIVLKRPS